MSAPGLTLDDVAAVTGAARVSSAVRGPLVGVSIDSRTLRPGELFVAIAGPRFDGHAFLAEAAARGAQAALVAREVAGPPPLPLLRVPDTTRALADLARHVRETAGVPVVAITGSMGKTTTKEMTAALLETRGPGLKTVGNLNNQYGLPLTLLRLSPEHRWAALELGMSAAGELRGLSDVARPDVAVITNVAPVHLEFFPSVDAIADAKAEILEGLRTDGAAVLNADDPRVRRIGAGRHDVVWFGRDRACDVSAENWRGTVFGMRFDLRLGGRVVDVALPLPGPHQVTNFLAAAAAAHRLGVDPDAIADAATRIQAAPHRGQVHRLPRGVTLYDDCYNANPHAVEAAVAALDMAGRGRRIAVLGDMLELGPTGPALHEDVGARIAPTLDVLVAVGPLAAHFLAGARRSGMSHGALVAFPDAAAAAAAMPGLVTAGDAVLVKGSRGVHLEHVVDALLARDRERE